jgi:hypothetical protein
MFTTMSPVRIWRPTRRNGFAGKPSREQRRTVSHDDQCRSNAPGSASVERLLATFACCRMTIIGLRVVRTFRSSHFLSFIGLASQRLHMRSNSILNR